MMPVLRVLLLVLLSFPSLAWGADNLLQNPSFDTDITGWITWPGAYTATWDAMTGASAPGSMALTTGSAFVNSGLTQCVAVSPSTIYEIKTLFMVPSSSPNDPMPRVQVQWHLEGSCISAIAGSPPMTITPPIVHDTWQLTSAEVLSPAAAGGAMFSLSVDNSPGGETAFWYDDVFMGPSAIFSDGFETGDPSGWTISVP